MTGAPTTETPLPWINESAIAQLHPLIFHYTQEKNVEAILGSGGLFATDYRQMNDPDELHALRNPLATLMTQSALPLLRYARALGRFSPPVDMDLDQVARAEATKFHDIMVRALPSPPHLTCFCGHSDQHHRQNGLLTMWRHYGRGEGIALGFDTAKLIEISEGLMQSFAIDGIYLDQVLYGTDNVALMQRMLQAPAILQNFAENLILMLQNLPEGPEISKESFLQFLVLVCGAKHADFRDEQEIRLVVTPAYEGQERGRTRAEQLKPGKIVLPYLDALKQIMIGPSANQEETALSMRTIMERHGLSHVEIVKSEIQFRFV